MRWSHSIAGHRVLRTACAVALALVCAAASAQTNGVLNAPNPTAQASAAGSNTVAVIVASVGPYAFSHRTPRTRRCHTARLAADTRSLPTTTSVGVFTLRMHSIGEDFA